jgi:hypothetical protein
MLLGTSTKHDRKRPLAQSFADDATRTRQVRVR